MGRLIYSMITSLDGYVADEKGNFDWAEPDEEVHRFVNDRERAVGTYLYGRRMYETMVYWETQGEETDFSRDYATIWRSANKVVYSRTLSRASSKSTRVMREFDVDGVRRLKAETEKDLTISGPELAGQALRAGLVDEIGLFVVPLIVGGGHPALPHNVHVKSHLIEERRFANGTVFLRYETVHS